MQAAFVDIGESKNVFLHIKDIIPKQSNETGNKNESFENINIERIIKNGMNILVQIQKDSYQSKGAKASTHIKISGRYAVLIPNVDFVTASTKIEDKEEISRLKTIVKKCKIDNTGIIIRTSAMYKGEEEILEDIKFLNSKWKEINKTFQKSNISENCNPFLIYKNYSVLEKLLIDLIDKNINKIIVNNVEMKKYTENFLKQLKNTSVDIEVKKDYIFRSDINKQLKKAEDRKIWLKCGGFITIDKTEALTAIDVNTGKYIGKDNNNNNMIYNVNKEATVEIAKQIRLRDIGGIIIIDYVDMNEDNKKKIMELWNECIKKDRSKIQLVDFTPLNLLEITRKHMWSQ